jgi:SAM-dependent methyltransferase
VDKTTAREVVRHTLRVTRLESVLMRRRRSKGQDIGHLAQRDRRRVFAYIYDRGVWLNGKDEGPLSGLGSAVEATAVLRQNITTLVESLGAQTILDVGCGDFTWMKHVDLGATRYIGVDVVPSVIAANQAAYSSRNREFLCLDAAVDELPKADLALCREVLFHLSFADCKSLLRNIKRSGAGHAMLTSDTGTRFNANIATGDFRILNLERRPFRLPRPTSWIADNAVSATRGIGLWPASALS